MSSGYLPEHLAPFMRALEVADREARALDASWRGLAHAQIDAAQLEHLAPESALAIAIEAFAARFGRLQDHLGEKLIPRLLALLGETPLALIDNLNRAERLGVLDDALDWLAWRKLRNRLVHEYLQGADTLAQAIGQALLATPRLTATVDAIRRRARQTGAPV